MQTFSNFYEDCSIVDIWTDVTVLKNIVCVICNISRVFFTIFIKHNKIRAFIFLCHNYVHSQKLSLSTDLMWQTKCIYHE